MPNFGLTPITAAQIAAAVAQRRKGMGWGIDKITATENLKTMQIAAAVAQRSKGGGKERKKLDKTTVSLTHIAAATQKKIKK